jgi:hypothetical protein
MDLEGVLGVVALLLHWRAVLCLIVSSVAAFLLVQHFPWFTGLQGIALAALGLLPGVIWEEAARPTSSSPTARTSTSVAVLAAVVFAAIWGAVSSTSAHSALAGAVVFVAAAWGWYRYAVVSQGWLLREQGILCTVIATLAYPLAALLAHNAF